MIPNMIVKQQGGLSSQRSSLCVDCEAPLTSGKRGPRRKRCLDCRTKHHRLRRWEIKANTCRWCGDPVPDHYRYCRDNGCQSAAAAYRRNGHGRCCRLTIVNCKVCGKATVDRGGVSNLCSEGCRDLTWHGMYAKWKSTHKCCVCGIDVPEIIDAHHRDPKEKLFDPGGRRYTPTAGEMAAELAKCLPLCRNHHTLWPREATKTPELSPDEMITRIRTLYPGTIITR